jgi:hypothetical protein
VTPGTYPDLSFDDYLRIDAASKSKLHALYTRTPLHCLAEKEPTPDMIWGTAFHLAVLQPDLFATSVVSNPHDGRTKAGKDFVAENGGKIIVPEDGYNRILAAREALLGNATVRALIEREGVSEATGIWTDPDTGVLCRCRPDHYVPSLAMIADLKSTANAGPSAFAKTAAQFGYDLQAEFYSEGWNRAGGGEVEDFIFIVVERDPPFAHAIYQLDESARLRGRTIMQKALLTYQQCKAAGSWPGYPATISRLSFPQWVYTQGDAA